MLADGSDNLPVDCSRWTPLGMTYFLSEAGCPIEVIKTGSWGNRAAPNG